jgi:hypothetical protein
MWKKYFSRHQYKIKVHMLIKQEEESEAIEGLNENKKEVETVLSMFATSNQL